MEPACDFYNPSFSCRYCRRVVSRTVATDKRNFLMIVQPCLKALLLTVTKQVYNLSGIKINYDASVCHTFTEGPVVDTYLGHLGMFWYSHPMEVSQHRVATDAYTCRVEQFSAGLRRTRDSMLNDHHFTTSCPSTISENLISRLLCECLFATFGIVAEKLPCPNRHHNRSPQYGQVCKSSDITAMNVTTSMTAIGTIPIIKTAFGI